MVNDPERHLQVRLEARLEALGIWYKFLEKSESTVHTADAASVTGIELHRISKNLMAQVNHGRYAALIIPGDMKLDYKEAAKALEAKKRQFSAVQRNTQNKRLSARRNAFHRV